MNRWLKRCLPLLACLTLLCACSTGTVQERLTNPLTESLATEVPGVETILPQAEETGTVRSSEEAVLYFRFRDEPYLAQETRVITRTASQTYEMALISQLLQGPGTAGTDLNGLFPDGTQVLSTTRQGRTLFVTLSAEIMNAYPDEPVDWQENETYREECPLRRRLCMQSLVATVTENCDVDQVQVLVEQENASVTSLRLKQNYFLDDSEDDVLVGPMTRDPSMLLSAENTLRVLLDAWCGQDWQRMYNLMAVRDPVSGDGRATENDFIAAMSALRPVVRYTQTEATTTADGSCATFAVSFAVLNTDGTVTELTNRIVRLYRVNGLWKTGVSSLTGWMEVLP